MGRRQELSDAVAALGWRFMLGTFRASVPVSSPAEGLAVASLAVDAGSPALTVVLRPNRVLLAISPASVPVARAVADGLRTGGYSLVPAGAQMLEIAVDAIDIPAVRPFWRAVLAYADDDGDLVDPAGVGPAVWFQQMDAPRPQRNRLHLDVSVAHDEAADRVAAALAAGGRLVSDSRAPAFWVLADAEGNEACVSTWQGRD